MIFTPFGNVQIKNESESHPKGEFTHFPFFLFRGTSNSGVEVSKNKQDIESQVTMGSIWPQQHSGIYWFSGPSKVDILNYWIENLHS